MTDGHAASRTAVASVDQDRLWGRLMELAKLGAIPGDGVNRACLTANDRAARRLMIGWAEAAGAVVSIDAAANLWLRVAGTDPAAAPVVTGSHMDSQPHGGRFDGIFGVVAGLEAISAMADAGVRPRRSVEVVGWTNEEGARFAPGCMGSMAWSGVRPIESFAFVEDHAGIRFGDALAEHLALEADLPRRALGGVPHAYVEAHIEQGPRLETEGVEIGVVTGIQGSRWFKVTISGASAHAGTTPLAMRRDAVQGMVRAIAALNVAMHDPADVLRFTVGRMVIEPNSGNSVAGKVVFSIDLRHPEQDVLIARGDAIVGVVGGAVGACDYAVEEIFHALPKVFDRRVIAAVEDAARAQGYSNMRLPSGASHDAQFVQPVCPTGMIFVPSHNGISHNPAEYSTPAQCAAGATVLTGALISLSE